MASRRWHIEHIFETTKQKVELDNYEVCNITGWYRHIPPRSCWRSSRWPNWTGRAPKKSPKDTQSGGLAVI